MQQQGIRLPWLSACSAAPPQAQGSLPHYQLAAACTAKLEDQTSVAALCVSQVACRSASQALSGLNTFVLCLKSLYHVQLQAHSFSAHVRAC